MNIVGKNVTCMYESVKEVVDMKLTILTKKGEGATCEVEKY